MPAQYIVTYGSKELPPLHVWQNALAVAQDLSKSTGESVSIVNLDGIDVCMDSDCQSCSHDGLTAEERQELNDAGIG